MTVEYCCEAYEDMKPVLSRVRDFLAGERCVKGRGPIYLPQLADQLPDEYDAYKGRAVFLNATGRTHAGLLGQVFRKDPEIELPTVVESIMEDADMGGTSLYGYASTMASEVLAAGRAGTLVEWSEDEARPYLCTYTREDIINWNRERVAGRMVLTLVVLKECVDKATDEYEDDKEERLRVLKLDTTDPKAPAYSVEVWAKLPVAAAANRGESKGTEWVLIEERVPTRLKQPLAEIPFVFHDPGPARGDDCPRPPLDDLVSLNLSHYTLSADHRHGLHFTALPTAVVSGFDPKQQLRIGSQVAWVSESPEAHAAYLEFSGAGLGTIRTELDRLEASMAAMGARLLETQKREAESAEALALRQAGESSVLTSIAGALSQTLSQALRWAAWWADTSQARPEDVDAETCHVELNTDFATSRMTAAELVNFVSAWQSRGISRATLHYNLLQGELLPPGTTMEDEVAAIEADSTALGPTPEGDPNAEDVGS